MNPHTDNPKEAEGAKKCPMHLLPTAFTTQTAYAMKHGAERYGEWNWRDAGIHATTYIGAIMSHLAAWQDGEDLDESGYSHIAHIAASCAIILDAEKMGMLVDDRKKTPIKEDIRTLVEITFDYQESTNDDIPPPPPRSKLPKWAKEWVYRGKGWKCDDLPARKFYANCGRRMNRSWGAYDYFREDWPEGMGYYYEAV